MSNTKAKSQRINVEDRIPDPDTATNPFKQTFKSPKLKHPKSKLEKEGINGPEFSEFIWNLVNEENNGSRPEPQVSSHIFYHMHIIHTSSLDIDLTYQYYDQKGADSPNKHSEPTNRNSNSVPPSHLKPPQPEKSKSPTPPTAHSHQASNSATDRGSSCLVSEPVIETGKQIFSMTSIE